MTNHLRFSKGDGLGNDYIVVDAAELPLELTTDRIRRICDRHRGVGSDGILVADLSDGIALRIWNPDGTEAEKSGNGLRIFGAWLHGRGIVGDNEWFPVRLIRDTVRMRIEERLSRGQLMIRAEMGRATFNGQDVDFTPSPGETLDYFCENGPLLDYDGRLTVRSLKLYMDGALGSRGAALLEPYADDPDNRGLLLIPPDRFETVVERAMRCGLQVNTHAIGDRANHLVLDVYERAIAETGGGPGRHRIEHAQVVVTPDDIERFAPLGVIASMQPTHATSDMPWAEDRVGPERIRGGYAWRTVLDTGTRLALGSDFPVERVSPLLGFYAAVTRQDAAGQPPGGWYPDQRLTREEALRGFTLDAAYAGFMEDEVGSLEAGKRADFVIFSRDIMAVPEAEILEAEVVATYLDGVAVYGGL